MVPAQPLSINTSDLGEMLARVPCSPQERFVTGIDMEQAHKVNVYLVTAVYRCG